MNVIFDLSRLRQDMTRPTDHVILCNLVHCPILLDTTYKLYALRNNIDCISDTALFDVQFIHRTTTALTVRCPLPYMIWHAVSMTGRLRN